MYSDEWLVQGYSSGEQVKVSEFAYYRVWFDKAGNEIGASADFECLMSSKRK